MIFMWQSWTIFTLTYNEYITMFTLHSSFNITNKYISEIVFLEHTRFHHISYNPYFLCIFYKSVYLNTFETFRYHYLFDLEKMMLETLALFYLCPKIISALDCICSFVRPNSNKIISLYVTFRWKWSIEKR